VHRSTRILSSNYLRTAPTTQFDLECDFPVIGFDGLEYF
jgi:hypothetical protein